MEGTMFGRNGSRPTAEDFAIMPHHHRKVLLALVEGEAADADPQD